MAFKQLWAPTPSDSTAEAVYTNNAAVIAKVGAITIHNPAGGATTNLRFHICAAGAQAAGNMVCEKVIPAGPYFEPFYPQWAITGVNTVTIVSSVTDDICVTTGSGTIDAE